MFPEFEKNPFSCVFLDMDPWSVFHFSIFLFSGEANPPLYQIHTQCRIIESWKVFRLSLPELKNFFQLSISINLHVNYKNCFYSRKTLSQLEVEIEFAWFYLVFHLIFFTIFLLTITIQLLYAGCCIYSNACFQF